MDTTMITMLLIPYCAISLIAFLGIWKELEKDYDKFWELPQAGRILCRTFAILFWPIYVMPCAVQLISILLRRLYESFTE